MEDPSLTSVLEVATVAARRAGELLLASFGGSHEIRHKGAINLVTEADEAAEALVVGELRRRFPRDSVLAEEGTQGGGNPLRRWIIDPLDGTTNFAHGYPVFAVSIALEVRGVVEAGVVYQPVLDELFTAIRGSGAFLNGEPIRVSDQGQLRQSLLSTGFAYDHTEIEEALALFGRFVRSAQAVRRDGSAVLNLCYVAMGRFEGFWERHLNPWDVAAGGLILTEAGGKLSDYRGAPFDIRGMETVASNGLIHDQMLATIQQSAVSDQQSVVASES